MAAGSMGAARAKDILSCIEVCRWRLLLYGYRRDMHKKKVKPEKHTTIFQCFFRIVLSHFTKLWYNICNYSKPF